MWVIKRSLGRSWCLKLFWFPFFWRAWINISCIFLHLIVTSINHNSWKSFSLDRSGYFSYLVHRHTWKICVRPIFFMPQFYSWRISSIFIQLTTNSAILLLIFSSEPWRKPLKRTNAECSPWKSMVGSDSKLPVFSADIRETIQGSTLPETI